MKKIFSIVLVAALVFISSNIFAQQQNHQMGQQHGQHRVEMLKKELGLSADQTKQLESVFSKMRDNKTANREQAKADFDNQVKKILTPEQYTKFLQMGQRNEKNGHKMMGKKGENGKKECKGDCKKDANGKCTGECKKDAKGKCTGECKKDANGKPAGECKGDCKKDAKGKPAGECKGDCKKHNKKESKNNK